MKWKKALLFALFNALVFWSIDWLSHILGGSETIFYYTSKLFNSFVVSIVIFKWFWSKIKKNQLNKAIASVLLGFLVSIYYYFVSYGTGFVQSLGITALTSPPTFFAMSPYLWGPAHMFYFWIALNMSLLLEKAVKEEK